MQKEELINAILNLPKNKEFKREKIQNVALEVDNENEIQFIIGTNFAEILVGFVFNNDSTVSSYGNILSTAYEEIDELLCNSYNESILGEWFCDFGVDDSINVILEEIISQIAQDDWKVRFKLLWKAYNIFEKFMEQFNDLDAKYLLEEMARNYFDK